MRLLRKDEDAAGRKRLLAAVDDMRSAGVLMDVREDTSRYSARIVEAYVRHRPFPAALVEFIVDAGCVGRASRVLDLAGGPRDLALGVARTSEAVGMMDLSRSFVSAARARAKRLGLNLEGLHDACNRLVYLDAAFDVITISQALHWRDTCWRVAAFVTCCSPAAVSSWCRRHSRSPTHTVLSLEHGDADDAVSRARF